MFPEDMTKSDRGVLVVLWIVALAGLGVTMNALFSGALELFSTPGTSDAFGIAAMLTLLFGGGFVALSVSFAGVLTSRKSNFGTIITWALAMSVALLVIAFFSFRFWYDEANSSLNLDSYEISDDINAVAEINTLVSRVATADLERATRDYEANPSVAAYRSQMLTISEELGQGEGLRLVIAGLESNREERRTAAVALEDTLEDRVAELSRTIRDLEARRPILETEAAQALEELRSYGAANEDWQTLLSQTRAAFLLECPEPATDPFEPGFVPPERFRIGCGPQQEVEQPLLAVELEAQFIEEGDEQVCRERNLRGNTRNTGTGPCTDVMLANYFRLQSLISEYESATEELETTLDLIERSQQQLPVAEADLEAASNELSGFDHDQEEALARSTLQPFETAITEFQDQPTLAGLATLRDECRAVIGLARSGDGFNSDTAPEALSIDCTGANLDQILGMFTGAKERSEAVVLACDAGRETIDQARSVLRSTAQQLSTAEVSETIDTLKTGAIDPCLASARTNGFDVADLTTELDRLVAEITRNRSGVAAALDRYTEMFTLRSNIPTYTVLVFTLIVELWFFGMKVYINNFMRARTGDYQRNRMLDEPDRAAVQAILAEVQYRNSGSPYLPASFADEYRDALRGRMKRLVAQFRAEKKTRINRYTGEVDFSTDFLLELDALVKIPAENGLVKPVPPIARAGPAAENVTDEGKAIPAIFPASSENDRTGPMQSTRSVVALGSGETRLAENKPDDSERSVPQTQPQQRNPVATTNAMADRIMNAHSRRRR
ncbi:hypothetical protein [Gymnodinialimonas sp.]